MNKKGNTTSLISGLIIIAITIIFYFLTFKNIFTIPMRIISLIAILIAEVVGTIKAITTKDSIFKVATITTSIVHVICVFVCSIIFVNFMPVLLNTYILLNLLGWAILAIVDIAIIFFRGQVEGSNQELKSNQDSLRMCYVKAQSISVKCQSNECAKEMEKIAEMLKYSDNSVATGDELTIMNMLRDIEQISDDDEMMKKMAEIKNIIEIRTINAKELQRGNF